MRFKTLFSILISATCVGWLSAHATPVDHGISAANVTVTQLDASNNAVSISQYPTLSINDFRVINFANPSNSPEVVIGTSSSRADYFIQIGTNASDDVTNGIVISSITDNGRNSGETGIWSGTHYGFAGLDTGATISPDGNLSGGWWVPVFGISADSTTSPVTYASGEYNFDYASAYFPYSKFYGGWLINSNRSNGQPNNLLVGNTNLVLGTNVIDLGGGKTLIDLRTFGLTPTNAILLCNGGKNEDNYADSFPNVTEPAYTNTWIIQCRNWNSGGEQDFIAFAVVPIANTNVIAGRFESTAGTDTVPGLGNAPFIATHTSSGTYHLTIPGKTPANGVLIISADGDGPNNGDNIVSYKASGDGWDIQTRDTGSNQNANLQNFTGGDTVVDFVFIPAPTAGVAVTPTNGLATAQDGRTATFSVVLDAPPTAEVDLALASSDPTAGLLSTGSLVFYPTNWNLPQTITVTGMNNSVTTPENYTIDFQPVISADTNYNGFQPHSVAIVNIPTGSPGIFLIPATGLTTTGSGGTANFQVILNFAPASDVTLGFASSDTTGGGIVSPAPITFNAENWSTPQIITVTGVDDSIEDGNIAYQINATPAVSTDVNYSGYNAGSVSVVNLENDVAGVVTSVNSIAVLEGNTSTFTAALTVKPISNVTVAYTSSAPGAGIVSPTSLTFTPDNWNVPQTFTLTGIANPANNGNVDYELNGVITSGNYGYSTLTLPDIDASTTKAIGLPSGTAVYGLGMPPVGIDGRATASSGLDFSGATLTFTLTTNVDALDVLGVRNDGTALGQIGVSGNSISYGGSPLATFSGGLGSSPLVISIGSGITGDAVAALVEAVTFSTTTTNNYGLRNIQVGLSFGSGGSSTVNKSIRVGLLRITEYQDGADYGYGTYNGEADLEIAQNSGGAFPSGSVAANGLLVQESATSTQHQVLLRFDDLIGTNAGQIPPGSIIVAADLNINVLQNGTGFPMNRMLIPWDATNSSWYSFNDVDGDNGIYADDNTASSELNSFVGTLTRTAAGGAPADVGTGPISFSVTSDVQAWADGETNCGWVCAAFSYANPDSLLNTWQTLTDNTGFTPSEDPTVTKHPRLRVYWLPAGVASTSFREGVNGYNDVHDTEITQSQPNNVVDTTLNPIWSDANDLGSANKTEALIRFDNIIGSAANQIPPGARIEAAVINVSSQNSSDAPGNGGQFFPLYQTWDETTVTWNTWGASGIQTNGVAAAATATAAIGGQPPLSTPAGFHAFEVTTDVQNWANGAPNNGWGIIPWTLGANGWCIDTSESSAEIQRPQLVVYYTPTAGYAARPTLLPLTVSSTQVQVKFSGTIGTTYTVWRADSVAGTWVNVGSATVSADGTATFNDTTPLSAAGFYRVSTP